MAFQVSPGVLVQEQDLTSVIPSLSTSIGGVVIEAPQGPAKTIITVSSESEFVTYFVKPNDSN